MEFAPMLRQLLERLLYRLGLFIVGGKEAKLCWTWIFLHAPPRLSPFLQIGSSRRSLPSLDRNSIRYNVLL